MLKLVQWIDDRMPSNSHVIDQTMRQQLDAMQVEALKQLQEGRKFMTATLNEVCAKYYNEQKAG